MPVVLLASRMSTAASSALKARRPVFAGADAPCYRCLYPSRLRRAWPELREGACWASAWNHPGLIQATEVVKLILGLGESLQGRLLLYDALAMRFRELKLRKRPRLPDLRYTPDQHETHRLQPVCGVPQAFRHAGPGRGRDDPVAVKARLDSGRGFQLIDVREPRNTQICQYSTGAPDSPR